MNKLFQQMNKIEAEITAGLKDEVGESSADASPPPRPARAASPPPPPSDRGVDESARLRQQIKKLEARLSEKVELCNDKDAQIAAVLAEGETLSKRQAEQEQTIRKLRANIRDVQTAADKQADVEKALRAELAETKTKLEHAQAEIAEARRVRAVCGPSSAGLGSADRGGGDGSVHSTPAEHALALQQALRRAETAEAKESSLSASIAELHLENARLAQAARWRDEGLTVRLGELETRSGNAEAHASELAAAVARETQPLLKQVASLQSQLSKVHAAWKASDADLKRRLAQAEASAATSGDEAARHLSALAAGEAELARVREHAAAERKSLMEARDAADARALGEGKRASLAEAEVARVRHSLERAEAALAQSDHALAETRGRATDLAAELRHEREVSNEERRARAQEMHDSRAQQVQARVQAGRLNGAIDIADWRSSSLLKPTRVAGVQSWHADGSGGNTSNEGDSVGLRALIAAMEAKEQTLIESLVELNLRHEDVQVEMAGMKEALHEIHRLRDEHAMALEMLGEKEERVIELENQLRA